MVRHRQKSSTPLLHAIDSVTGNIVHINNVRAKHTHLICPSDNCKWPLTPVLNVTKKIKHFRHKPDGRESDRDCKDPEGAQESIVHKLAKEVMLKRKNMFLFGYSHTFDRYKNKHLKPLVIGRFIKSAQVYFTNVESEVRRTAKDYQPDITALFEDEEFIIEIHYKHLVDQEKLEKIIRDDIPAVEISLGYLNDDEINAYEIDKALVNPDNFKWLHFPRRWFTDKDLSDIAQHEATEKKYIDDEIERQKKLAKQRELEAQKKREQYEKEQVQAEALRKEHFLAEYIQEYLEYLLKDKRISPFSKKERNEIKVIFTHIDRVNTIISHRAENTERHFHSIPNRKDYTDIIERIGDDYRWKQSKKVLEIITHRNEWVSKYLITLHELGWGEGRSLRSLINFKDEVGVKFTDDEFLPVKLFINNELLPHCKSILEKYIEGFQL